MSVGARSRRRVTAAVEAGEAARRWRRLRTEARMRERVEPIVEALERAAVDRERLDACVRGFLTGPRSVVGPIGDCPVCAQPIARYSMTFADEAAWWEASEQVMTTLTLGPCRCSVQSVDGTWIRAQRTAREHPWSAINRAVRYADAPRQEGTACSS